MLGSRLLLLLLPLQLLPPSAPALPSLLPLLAPLTIRPSCWSAPALAQSYDPRAKLMRQVGLSRRLFAQLPVVQLLLQLLCSCLCLLLLL